MVIGNDNNTLSVNIYMLLNFIDRYIKDIVTILNLVMLTTNSIAKAAITA